jgi:hypothetical protein
MNYDSGGDLEMPNYDMINYEGLSSGSGSGGNSKESTSIRNNSPLNMKHSKFLEQYGAMKSRPAKENDGTYEAKFNSIEEGLNAAKALWSTNNYSNKSVIDGLKRWSDNTYDKGIYKEVADFGHKSFRDLTPSEKDRLIKAQVKFEDGNMYKKLYGNK